MTKSTSAGIPSLMQAVHLTGHGGFECLEVRDDVPVPNPGDHEVLVHVGAAGVNNTDINTRIGWYSKTVTGATDSAASDGFGDLDGSGDWSGAGIGFPRIQGADIAGRIVAVGDSVDSARVGQRVLVRPMQTALDGDPLGLVTVGSEFDGGFAQFCSVRSSEAFAIDSTLSDVELASFPCAYSTAECMLHRVQLQSGERLLVTGASGGVGSALIQLASRRGAEVVAVASQSKWPAMATLGAARLIDRSADLVDECGADSFDVVADVVAGPNFGALLDVLRRQGRYVTSGAIAGPIVDLDVRTLYLKDLTMHGSTFQPPEVFANLVGYIERGEVSPLVADSFPLAEIDRAQRRFLDKDFVGKLVLIPSPV